MQSVVNDQSVSCGITLGWPAATPQCGTGVRYNVYRSTTPGFTMRLNTHVAASIGRYHYVLRTGDNDLIFDTQQGVLPLEDLTKTHPLARRALRDGLAMHLAWVTSLGAKSKYGTATSPSKSFAPAALERGW